MMSQQIATFGGGCFWCIDAAFRRVRGVTQVASGYAGGHTDNPTYEQICTGRSGHAEVVQLTFDPQQVDFSVLLEMFFALHDPTQLNRQGNDIGTQYRSVVFYHSEEQQTLTQRYIDALAPTMGAPIVTEVSGKTHFYPAEQYHQDYYTNNPNQGYCSVMIAPKLAAFAEKFATYLDE
ncbi:MULTISPECIES: peptide-methionine (S)-S-oxide reductase MsrA [unclassified Pseudoalteromonas]|uniref:peptide-methionine (S)-S-oxide reductase MsrA n=1 Tax=unclassified Pseudoalteromonas TaxID=194690 RepID=UPI0020968A45|nr:peptide-methionine (S)-S-oxide reductase MsrA [Pseudoalteromonas sp. XMcav2-N]MCO7189446.1 peptide-methionine (S)-S-oxide reductase MsrA [Pseudoalteromonas sp. XMcav2-N]